MVIKDLVPVEWSNQRVLLSKQVAECYKCAEDRIKDNFNANKEQYTEGVHYFKITGSDLQNLRVGNPDLQISPKTRTLYLWTYKGCVRHCKSINTPEAWKMFDDLEKFYFSQNTPKAIAALAAPVAKEKPAIKSERPQLKLARVYVLEMSDGSVKIGYTKRFCNRMSEIKRQSKLSVKNIFFTAIMSRENARLVERCTKEIFSSSKLGGEFFSVKFDEACAAVDSFAKMACVAPIVYGLERGVKVLKLAGRKFD